MRAFVALRFTPDSIGRLSKLQDSIEAKIPDLRRLPRESLHATLAFLGEIDEEKAHVVLNFLRENPIVLPLRLAPRKRLDVYGWKCLVLELYSTPWLDAYQSKLQAVLIQNGIPSSDRDFHPHITLSRGFPKDASLSSLGNIPDVFPLEVQKAVLMESVLGRDRPFYREINE